MGYYTRMPDKRCCAKRCLRCWRNHMKHCVETFDPNMPYNVSSGNAHRYTEIKDLHNDVKEAIQLYDFNKAQILLTKLNKFEPNSNEVKRLENKLNKKMRRDPRLE